ncbi:MAG: TonB-dependent receptor plug domain-containing protein [Methylophilaceae bacterium]
MPLQLPRMQKGHIRFLISLCIPFASFSASADPLAIDSFADMSIEELGNIEITSVSKKPQSLSDAAASVFIITNEDIRRSGAATLPDALRLAPNLQVAQVSASGHAISARGLNGTGSAPNKLLVLIDGRSVYSPLFSGIFWDAQDVMLEDVERIEVISGPGSTLWGTNAVNGVVNIITRSAKDTQGALASARSGNIGSDTAFRYGGTVGGDGHFRVYAKSSHREDSSLEDGTDISDGWNKNQAGFRMDWDHAENQLSVTGNVYEGDIGQPRPGSLSVTGTTLALDTVSISGVNLTANWQHLLDNGSKIRFQAYYDRTLRKVPPTFRDANNIFDVEFQHSLKPIGRHALTWGANYRYSQDEFKSDHPSIGILPEDVNQSWLSLYGQDEISLTTNLNLTLGARLERNDYTGYEFLPDARLAWKVTPHHLLWTAVSRAVRAPSRLDADAFIPRNPPFLLNGGPDIRSEIATVYQLGYRGQISSKLNFEITAFRNEYDHLRTTEIDFSGPFLVFANEMEGSSHGIEMWGTYQVLPQWRISAGATFLNEKLELKPGSFDLAAPDAAGRDPSHTWQIRSAFNISHDKEFDLSVRHAGELSSPEKVPEYTAVDARFGWRVRKDIELSIIGQNLLGTEHAEYGARQFRSEIPQAIFFKVVWQP